MTHPFPKNLRRRIEILKSAASAFRRQGYHRTSVDDIAQALRMTKGSLYYYFKNKEEILYVCHDHTLDLLLAALKNIQATDQSAADKLRALVVAFVVMITEELHGTAAVTLDLEAMSPPLRRKIIAKRDRFDHGVRRIVREGIEQVTNKTLFGGAATDITLPDFGRIAASRGFPRILQLSFRYTF